MPTLLARLAQGVISIEKVRQMEALPQPPAASEVPAEEPAFGPPVDLPAPTAVASEVPAEELRAYVAVAEAIDFKPTHLVRERFRQTLAEAGLRRYDRKAVAAYLDHLWGCARTIPIAGQFSNRHVPWGWRPLRVADVTDGAGSMIFSPTNTNRILVGVEPYNKPVPLPVLLTVQRLLAAEPSAKFYVSDLLQEHEQPANRDPFLMVVVGGEAFIVERWDEPSFRG